MAKQLQLRKGTTTEHNTFTGAQGELTYDTTRKQLRVHDGSTVGGLPTTDDYLAFMPIPYPKSTPPVDYLAMMGQTISQVTYPKLYELYGSNLPDMRAYTIRGLDNGRGIDLNRVVLTEQGDAIRNITGSVDAIRMGIGWTPISNGALVGKASTHSSDSNNGSSATMTIDIDASRVVPTASENRVKNIAFLYIVKAG